MQRPQSLLAAAFDLIAAGELHPVRETVRANPELVDQLTFIAGGTLLHYAAARSTPEMVALLLELGFSVNAPGKHFGDKPIDSAASNGRADNARLLIEHGASVHGGSSHTDPLFGAVLSGSLQTVQVLLAAGANPRSSHALENGQVVNAEDFADLRGQPSIATFLRSVAPGA
jgi:ankyrin repeat protein